MGIALNFDGSLLATASDKGTLVRLFHTETGNLMQELRRGLDRAEVQCITFSSNSQWVVLSSDKGTVHVYAVHLQNQEGTRAAVGNGDNGNHALVSSLNKKSHFSGVLGFSSSFSSEWSFAQFRVPDCRCIVCFGSDPNTVIIACATGAYFKCRFDPRVGGDMIREGFKSFSMN